MNHHFHIPLNFSSSDDDYYEYDYSYEGDDDQTQEKTDNHSSKEKEKISVKQEPLHIVVPPREVRSDLLRPIPRKMVPNKSIPRPLTPESSKNSSLVESPSQNEKNIPNTEKAFVEERFFTIEMKRYKSFFGKNRKRFIMIDQNQIIYDLSIKSKEKIVKLPNKQHLEISKGYTEFSLKSDEKFQKELMRVTYSYPHERDECKRRTFIRFINMKNISLPSKLTSLPNLNDENFKGHYHIPSIRNAALVPQGSNTPVLSILELDKDRIEVRTNLNIDKDVIFTIGLTSFLCKIALEKNSIFSNLKSFSLSSTLRPIEKVIV